MQLSFITAEVIPVLDEKPCSPTTVFAGILTEVIALLMKLPEPSVKAVVLGSKVNDVNVLVPRLSSCCMKVLSPIAVTELGILIDVRLLVRNALSPIEVN